MVSTLFFFFLRIIYLDALELSCGMLLSTIAPKPEAWAESSTLFSSFFVLFSIPHISGTIQLLSFSDWLISLGIMSSRFIYALFSSVFKVKTGVEVVKTRM